MDHSKFTEGMSSRLSGVNAGELLDIVVELAPRPEVTAGAELQTRAEEIAARKTTFSREAGVVEAVVRQAGGEVIGMAWINRTVRCRLPTQAVGRLSQLDAVAALDVPRTIEPDVP